MAKQRNATDVTVKNLLIHTASKDYNLEPHLLELNIYEDIFSSYLSANMVLADSHNIPYKLPIVGEETIDIDISLSGHAGSRNEDKHSIKPPRLHVNSLTDRFFTKPIYSNFSSNSLRISTSRKLYLMNFWMSSSNSLSKFPSYSILPKLTYFSPIASNRIEGSSRKLNFLCSFI